MVQSLALRALLQDSGQIVPHARECVGADGLDPRLLQGVIDLGALNGFGFGFGVKRAVMMGDTQSHLIRQPANARGLHPGKLPRRMRQDRPVTHETRAIAREDDLQVRLFRQGARGVGQRALEHLRGAFLLGHDRWFIARGKGA